MTKAWISVVLVLLLTASLRAQVVTRAIHAGDGGAIVLVRFNTGGQTDAKAKGVAVVDSDGQGVPYRLMGHDPDGQTCIAIDLTGKKQPLSLQYGPKPLMTTKVDDKIQPSLVLQTYPLIRKSFRDLNDLLDSLAAAKPQGTMFVDRIDLAYNPFGPDEQFVSVFEGLLEIDSERTEKLFSANDDAAFVEIDGKVVISQTAPNLTRDPERIASQALNLTLAAGTHRIRYVHVQTTGTTLALLGHMAGDRAVPLGGGSFVSHRWANLGAAEGDAKKAAVGYDVQQIDQLGHENYTFVRFMFHPIAALPAGARYRWNFGDGTSAAPKEGGAIEHVFLFPPTGYPSWKVTLELIDAKGAAIGQAASTIRPQAVLDMKTIGDPEAMAGYLRAMAGVDYQKAEPETMAALYAITATLENPVASAVITEPFVKRFGDRGGPLVWEMKYSLATYVARDDPARAEKIYSELSRAGAKDTWLATCAAAEQIDILIFRLNAKPQDIRELVAQLYRDHTPRERALLKARIGDAYRQAGKMDEATAAYRDAQREDFRQLDARKAGVLDRAHRETAQSYLAQGRYPALRQELLEWEADFPLAKLGGDLPLLTGRYFQAVGDDPRAVQEFKTLLALNPLHPSLPEITFRLAQSLARTGQAEEAKELFAKVAKEYPNSPFAGDAERERW